MNSRSRQSGQQSASRLRNGIQSASRLRSKYFVNMTGASSGAEKRVPRRSLGTDK